MGLQIHQNPVYVLTQKGEYRVLMLLNGEPFNVLDFLNRMAANDWTTRVISEAQYHLLKPEGAKDKVTMGDNLQVYETEYPLYYGPVTEGE